MISRKFFRRLTAGAAVLAVSGAAAMVTTVAAGAAPGDGTLTIAPATGTDQTSLTGTTSAPCPADGNTNSQNVEVAGPGTFSGTFSGTSGGDFSNTAPFTATFTNTFATFASSTGQTIVPGKYDLVLRCVDDFNTESRRFTTSITFSDPTHYTADPNGSPGPSLSPSPSPTTTTTTTATTSPTTTSSASETTTTTPSTTTPTTTDDAITTPTSTNDVGVTSTPSDPSAGTQSLGATGTLAKTGGPIGLMFLGGLILFAVGLMVIVWLRRPRKIALGGGDHTAGESESGVPDDR